MKRIKNWLINNFLPLWAKETVLADNRRLKRKVKKTGAGYPLLERLVQRVGK